MTSPSADLLAPDFRALFESSPGLCAALTPDLKFVAASNAYLQATMTKREGIYGRGIFEVFPDNPNDSAGAGGVSKLRASLERVLQNKFQDTMAVLKYDVRRPETDGGGFEKRYWSTVNSPVFGPNNEITYIVIRVEDVTTQIRLREEIEEVISQPGRSPKRRDVNRHRAIKCLYWLAASLLLAFSAVSYRISNQLLVSRGWVEHTHLVIESLQRISLFHESAIAGLRIFLLENRPEFFQDYKRNQDLIPIEVASARQLTLDNPRQQQRFKALQPLIDNRLATMASIMSLAQAGHREEAMRLLLSNEDLPRLRLFKDILGMMEKEEEMLLDRRRLISTEKADLMRHMLLMGTLLSILVMLTISTWLRREARLAQADSVERKALRESEERYRLLVEGVKDYAIFMLDAEGRVLTWNDGAQRAKGYTSEEIIGQSMERFYTPEDRAQGKPAAMLKTAAERDRVEDEGWRVRKDGSRFWADVVITAVRDREKRLIGFSKITRDLSERKRAELELNRYIKERAQGVTEQGLLKQTGSAQKQALGESQERYRLLVEGVKDYAIFMLDAEGRVLTWNAGAQRIKGYTSEEIIGQPIERFYSAEDKALGKPAAMLRTAEAQGRVENEAWRIRKDGSRFWANVVITATRNSSGTLIGFSEISRDISELKETETKYRGLLEAAPDAMVVVNQNGDIVLLNVRAENQFGYRRDELLGQKVKNIIPEGFAERLIADGTRSAADALAQQIGTGLELYGRRKDGSEFPIEIMLSPLDSPEGILVTAAIREITERKKAEANLVKTVGELKRSNDELQQFATVASHDLQEPLRMITSYTQLLSKRYTGKLDADADEFIGYAADGASRMRRLIEDLLTFSRLGTNKVPFVQVDSNTILQRALMNLSVTLEESGAAVTFDPLPTVFAVESQYLQLFQNLVGNAIKYHGVNPPKIHVTAQRKELEWVFSIRDNGIGIDPQYADRIFVIFQRLHTIEKYPGTGIGLAVCKKIVERHGGRIWVESEPGQGSTFYFTMPIKGETKIGNAPRP